MVELAGSMKKRGNFLGAAYLRAVQNYLKTFSAHFSYEKVIPKVTYSNKVKMKIFKFQSNQIELKDMYTKPGHKKKYDYFL